MPVVRPLQQIIFMFGLPLLAGPKNDHAPLASARGSGPRARGAEPMGSLSGSLLQESTPSPHARMLEMRLIGMLGSHGEQALPKP